MKKYLITFIVLIIIGVGSFYLFKKPASNNIPVKNTPVVETPKAGIINSVTFSCAQNKNIQAIFFSDKVELNLSDGRNMLLPQAISASGARYANNDESFVFWKKGDTAIVEEGNKMTFSDCAIPSTEVKVTQ